MSDANKHSAIKGYGDALKQEAELENERYKNDASLRSSNDDMSDLFSSISNAAKSPGGRPRGLGANIAAGFSEGMSTGYKMKSTNEKKEKFGKYENVMNYLQKTQAAVTQQNQHYAEQEQRMETVKPFAIGALEVAYSGMDYSQGNERMRNIIDQAKLADPRIKGDYIGYVPNSPIVNLRDQDGKITAFSLSSLTGEDTVKRVQENYIKQQQLATGQDDLEIKKFEKGISGGAYGVAQNAADNPNGDIPLSKFKGKGISALVATANAEMGLAKDAPLIEKMLREAEDIIDSNKSLGSGYVNFLTSNSVSRGLLDKKTRNAYEQLDKVANRIAEAYIKAKGGAISDSEREIIKKGLFTPQNLDKSNKFNINSIRHELAIAKERGDYVGNRLAEGYIPTPTSFEKHMKSKENPQNGGEYPKSSGAASDDDLWNQIGRAKQ